MLADKKGHWKNGGEVVICIYIYTIDLLFRLSQFALRGGEDSKGIPEELKLFDIFSEEITSIIKSRPDMPPGNYLF